MVEALIDMLGEGVVLLIAGGVVGMAFGAAAQHSRFCLRAATVEVAEGRLGPRLATWLLAFFAAVTCVQGAIAFEWLEVAGARQLAATGSLSGAVIGGLMFGAGMILARGCASRLLVLSASGNLRALVTGLVLTLVAQASLRGALSPLREFVVGLWTVGGGEGRSLLALYDLSSGAAAVLGIVALAASVGFACRVKVELSRMMSAIGVGVAVALGWLATFTIAQNSFEVVPITSVTFTGPSTDTLMGLVNTTDLPMGFGIGLVPGVIVGAGVMALAFREFRIERFGPSAPMERYLLGAVLMGFGAMLAGGCAVGAGMAGGSIFAITAWLAVFCMWVGAVATHVVLQSRAGAPLPA